MKIKNSAVEEISVVIPAAAAPPCFDECLKALFEGEPSPGEVIIVNDAMDDLAVQIASNYPVKVIDNPGKGVASARNFGVKNARFPIILFIDTDVIISKKTFELLREAFEDKTVDGAVGIQSRNLRFTNFSSRFKNQWMRFTYKRLKKDIHLFYTSCAAVRRNVFLESGGFDEKYVLPSVEDTVFGAVLGRLNRRIVPLHAFEIEHVKKYGLWTVLKTDLQRSAALVRYILRRRNESQNASISRTSVPKRFMLSAFFMSLGLLAIFSIPMTGLPGLSFFALFVLLTLFLNSNWILHLHKEEGALFALKACIFIPIDVTFVVLGILTGFITFLLGKKY